LINYYKVLGVSHDADVETIKSQYRKLAKENHPDLNPGNSAAEARFKEIGEAWEVLGDADKRAKYDQSRTPTKAKAKTKRGTPLSKLDMDDLMNQFDSFFGKAAPAKKSSSKQTNPLDATDLFEKYMGITKK